MKCLLGVKVQERSSERPQAIDDTESRHGIHRKIGETGEMKKSKGVACVDMS